MSFWPAFVKEICPVSLTREELRSIEIRASVFFSPESTSIEEAGRHPPRPKNKHNEIKTQKTKERIIRLKITGNTTIFKKYSQ